MMLKIEKSVAGEFVVLTLSGRILDENLIELDTLVKAEQRSVMLDLKEVNLVGREAVRFLAVCEDQGIRLKDCPAYIREWMAREHHKS